MSQGVGMAREGLTSPEPRLAARTHRCTYTPSHLAPNHPIGQRSQQQVLCRACGSTGIPLITGKPDTQVPSSC